MPPSLRLAIDLIGEQAFASGPGGRYHQPTTLKKRALNA